MNNIITKLFLRRRELKVKQSELAEKIGVSPMAISHFEVGRRTPNLIMLERWASALGMKVLVEEDKKEV